MDVNRINSVIFHGCNIIMTNNFMKETAVSPTDWQTIRTLTAFKSILKEKKHTLLIVIFTAEWCRPCHQVKCFFHTITFQEFNKSSWFKISPRIKFRCIYATCIWFHRYIYMELLMKTFFRWTLLYHTLSRCSLKYCSIR